VRRDRRSALAGLGVLAAALVVGVCATVAFALSTGFDRSARAADLPDVVVRFDAARRADVDARLRTLPNVVARAYRFEATGVGLRAGDETTERGAVQVVAARGRHGYAVVDGRDLRPGRARETVVEQGVARAWGLGVGDRVRVGRLGRLRIAGVARSPDNVAFPLASAARVYVGEGLVRARFGGGELPVDQALLWLADRERTDVTLAQARSQAYGIHGISFLTRGSVEALIGHAAGVVVGLLVAFAVVALGAAGVMLGTAAHADVRRRLPGTAVRRALGFGRGRLARDAAARAARMTLPAAAAGLALGWLLAIGPTRSLLAILNEAPPGAAVLPLLAACLAAIVALVVGAATWPAWRATAGAPAALLRGGELAGRTGRRRTWAPRPPSANPLGLGVRLVSARRARFAGTVAVVAACGAVVLLMLALASLLERLRDDPATLGKRYALTLSAGEDALPAIRSVEGVEAAAPRWVLTAADASSLGEALEVVAFRGDHTAFEAPPLAEGRRLRGDGEAEVGLGLADALGLAPGGILALQLPAGEEVRFRVVGVVRALDDEGRIAYVRPARLGAAVAAGPPAIAVRLEPGASRTTVEARLRERGFEPTVVAGAAGRDDTLLGLLGDVLRVVAGAVGLVLLYALAQALSLTASERGRTLALLRTLGAGPGTVALVLAGAGAALVLPAALLAVALEGVVLAPVVADLAAGYADLPLRASAGQAVLVTAGLLGLASLAAAWVAWRLGRIPLATAMRERP
jgi:ABC-type antimicrobial peptide transport system permease subunit